MVLVWLERMQVLLINPRADFLEEPAFVPPLGLLYLGAALEMAGHEPRVVDLNLPSTKISGRDPRLIGIGLTTALFPAARAVVAACRREYPGVPVVVGGPHLSVRPGDYEKLGADYSGSGDCEIKIVYLAGMLARGFGVAGGFLPSWADVDVDAVPIPSRHLVPMKKYRCTLEGEPAATLIGARGCPFSCGFCSRWEGSRRVRARHLSNVIEEIRQLKDAGFNSFVFHDDEMNLHNDRLLELCRLLAPEKIHFKANVRADLLTAEQAEALAAAGCSWLCVGVESGNAGILKTANKGTTPEVNARARELCRRAGIKFKAFVIAGLPGESRATIADTRRWLVDNAVDDLTVTMFVPFPGSSIHDHRNGHDIRFEVDYERESLTFRGAAGTRLPHVVRTSGLTADELAELPEQLESEVRRELGLAGTYQGAA
jgi:anaerobic magnesium-protoporphyrin IX monomethyl ester cyclase